MNLALSGTPAVECRTGGANGNHTVVFTFSTMGNLVSGNASVTSGAGSVGGTPAFSGNTMSVNLTGVTNSQTTTVALTNITDSLGQVLPNASASVSFLLGDTNGNRSVNASDIAQTKSFSGQPADAANFRADVNLSGSISAADIALVKSAAGTSLPP